VELIKSASKRPRNRAPPPPPATHKGDGRPSFIAGVGAKRHQRSHSDVQAGEGGGQGLVATNQTSPAMQRRLSPKTSPLSERKMFDGRSKGQHPLSQQQQSSKSPVHPHKAVSQASRPKFVPPPPPGPAPLGPRERNPQQQLPSRQVNVLGEDKGIPRVVAPHPPEPDPQQSPPSGSSTPVTKPKRHAPPPPVGGAAKKTPTNPPECAKRGVQRTEPPPPAYAEVMKVRKVKHSLGGSEQGPRIRHTPPPPPVPAPSSEDVVDSPVGGKVVCGWVWQVVRPVCGCEMEVGTEYLQVLIWPHPFGTGGK